MANDFIVLTPGSIFQINDIKGDLNINYGHNQELMKHCRRLKEYSIFVQCVREYIQSEPSVEDALEKAIDTCINQDVLADFLKKHRFHPDLFL